MNQFNYLKENLAIPTFGNMVSNRYGWTKQRSIFIPAVKQMVIQSFNTMRILDNLLKEIGSALLKEIEDNKEVSIQLLTSREGAVAVSVGSGDPMNDDYKASGDLQSLIEKWYATYEGKEII